MTILFEADWGRFPRAIIDYETKNESFKRMVSLYKSMGVKNCAWPLALMQPELQGIDPHDENLSDEIKVAIGLECKYNFWYFLREVVRIPPSASPDPFPYVANRGNLALSWAFLNNIDIALIQPRQTGKSVSTDCIMTWVMYIGATNSIVNMITKDHALRTANVERLKNIRGYLPKYLVNVTNADSDNQIDLTCKALNNKYSTGVAQNSESAANNLGRGSTAPVLHSDEGPFTNFIGTTLPAALAAGTSAREEAELHNRPYGNIYTTTAGKKDDRDGRYMYDLIHKGSVWNEIFLDALNKDALKILIKRNCSGDKIIINATFSHRQLGKTDQWLFDAIVNAGGDTEKTNRDFFNVWSSGTQSSPLSVELNTIIMESEEDPLYSEISNDSYIIRWYHKKEELEELMNNTSVILSLDTSDAIGRDAIAMVFTNSKDLSTMGVATINETNLIRYSKFLAEVLIKYTNVTLVIERKSSAQAIIDALLIHLPNHDVDPFKRIFNSIVDKKDERKSDFEEIQIPMSRRNGAFYDRWKKVFGFNTTGASRELLFSNILQNAAKEAGHLVKDRTLSGELRGLVVKNGRIDHSSNSHDDHVISWLMGHWLLTHSKNLYYYGIDITEALSGVHKAGKALSDYDLYLQDKQKCIRQQMESLYEDLTGAMDEITITKCEAKMVSLNRKLKIEDGEGSAFSIDSLLNNAREARDCKNKQNSLQQRRELQHRTVGLNRQRSNYYR